VCIFRNYVLKNQHWHYVSDGKHGRDIFYYNFRASDGFNWFSPQCTCGKHTFRLNSCIQYVQGICKYCSVLKEHGLKGKYNVYAYV